MQWSTLAQFQLSLYVLNYSGDGSFVVDRVCQYGVAYTADELAISSACK
jgi:hypothetical protein